MRSPSFAESAQSRERKYNYFWTLFSWPSSEVPILIYRHCDLHRDVRRSRTCAPGLKNSVLARYGRHRSTRSIQPFRLTGYELMNVFKMIFHISTWTVLVWIAKRLLRLQAQGFNAPTWYMVYFHRCASVPHLCRCAGRVSNGKFLSVIADVRFRSRWLFFQKWASSKYVI